MIYNLLDFEMTDEKAKFDLKTPVYSPRFLNDIGSKSKL